MASLTPEVGYFSFCKAHAALCPITHSTRLLPIRVPSPPPYSLCLSSSLDPFILGGLGSPQLFCRGFQFHFLGPFYKLGYGSPSQNQTHRRVSKSKPRFCTWEKNIFLNRQQSHIETGTVPHIFRRRNTAILFFVIANYQV